MKPWRPYWKALDAAVDMLIPEAGAPPVTTKELLGDWISERKFLELCSCDQEAESLARTILAQKLTAYHQVLAGTEIRWQLIFRCWHVS